MTLITNEIYMLDGFRQTLIVFAADQRISKPDGTFIKGKKLFRIPYLEGCVSYFGLAEVFPANRRQYLFDWLPKFITSNAGLTTLRAFAYALRDELNRIVPANMLKRNASGFHICGYNERGLPEFWYLSNIGGMDAFAYKNLSQRYGDPSPDFLDRDAKKLGWDGSDLRSIRNEGWIYRNGDVRVHAVLADRLDTTLKEMSAFPDFRVPKSPDDLRRWVQFKFEVISYFYEKFARKAIIGKPIDVLTMVKKLP